MCSNNKLGIFLKINMLDYKTYTTYVQVKFCTVFKKLFTSTCE